MTEQPDVAAEAHPWTALPALFAALDTCLATAVDAATARYGVGPGADPYRSLYVGEAQVRQLLADLPLAGRLGLPTGPAAFPPLEALAGDRLDRFDTAVLVLAAAPDVDGKYERIFGYLHDDLARRRPTVGLAIDLFCADLPARVAARDRFSPDAPLRRSHVVELGGDDGTPLLARPILPDPQWVRYLLGSTGLAERLAGRAELVTAQTTLAELPLPAAPTAALAAALAAARAGDLVRLALTGDDAPLFDVVAAAVAGSLGHRLLRLHPPEVAPHAPDTVRIAVTEGWLLGLPVQLPAAALTPTVLASGALARAGAGGPVLVTGAPAGLAATLARAGFATVPVPPPGPAERRRWWAAGAADADLGDADLDRLAARYALPATGIRTAVALARGHAALHPGEPFGVAALRDAARRLAGEPLAGLAQRVEIHASWDDIVLPPRALRTLHELCDRVLHRTTVLDGWQLARRTGGRRGVNALFAGPSGTGKTMAAQVVAGELGLDLFAIDLSTVVSKYIGETEKNLDAIFAAARHADAVLLFDEADALFGKRSEVRDSHDRYANLEISYLLQRMEAHDGVAVLATNLRQNLDEAFLRRLAFTVHFPFPDAAQRRAIWAAIWPTAVPLAGDVDIDALAQRFPFSGGNIRNVALAAAFLAAAARHPVTMADVLAAVDREYEKLGRPVAASEVAAGSARIAGPAGGAGAPPVVGAGRN